MAYEFKTSLLREKFVLRDPAGDNADTPPIIALSNRMVVPLANRFGDHAETYVIRTQNMHSCTRLAAAIAKEYYEHGPIMSRDYNFNWGQLWNDVIKGYEKDWNPDIWAAVYYKGRVVFEDGERHGFLDIIEKCDTANKQDYTQSVLFAESAFRQAGKAIKIEHDSNIALIVSIKEDEAKCGIILRGATRKTTFNYTVKTKKLDGDPIRIPTILTAAAAFLEGVQLAFAVGMINRKRDSEMIDKYSDEDRKGKRGAERLINLGKAIESLERKYVVSYRPDRPDFPALVKQSEEIAMKILRPQIEAKLATGEIDMSQWVQ